ncbi:hypothetical protein N1851_023295 [Merluccius polli]|uniref:Uncharacterized protein n=1 Tax=Merluccius polli TaxID=89951 RepID=A0AA47MGS1_MERPO|nr:hypothetical protein N1851_023295 [Merluccius polli]
MEATPPAQGHPAEASGQPGSAQEVNWHLSSHQSMLNTVVRAGLEPATLRFPNQVLYGLSYCRPKVSCNNPELLNDTITSYLNFCADNIVDTKEVRIYPNNKPWVNNSFKHILNQKKIAFKEGDRQNVKDLEKELTKVHDQEGKNGL